MPENGELENSTTRQTSRDLGHYVKRKKLHTNGNFPIPMLLLYTLKRFTKIKKDQHHQVLSKM